MESTTHLSPSYKRYVFMAMAYAVAIVVACLAAYAVSPAHPLWVIAVGDIAGTLVIFGFSRFFNNSSFYDPYWSVGPIVIASYLVWMTEPGTSDLRTYFVLGAVWVWGIRLTYNFLRGWPDLGHEDWRYVDFRKSSGTRYWLVSFSALHLFPTVMVYGTCLTLLPALQTPNVAWGLLDSVAAMMIGGAILIETIADEQLRKFVHTNRQPGTTLNTGLWAWSRHPNYLGELGFWWALFLFGFAANPAYWWTIAGPIALTAMFIFASLPLIETRMMKRRTDYSAYKKQVPSAIIPWPPAKNRS